MSFFKLSLKNSLKFLVTSLTLSFLVKLFLSLPRRFSILIKPFSTNLLALSINTVGKPNLFVKTLAPIFTSKFSEKSSSLT